MADEPQGAVYAAFVSKQLSREYDRRDSINSRAGAAVTGSGGLVTLVLAVVAFSHGKDYVARGAGLGLVIVAVVALLTSAALAVGAGFPRKFEVRDLNTLEQMLLEHWSETEPKARNTTAFFEVDDLRGLRAGNNKKQRMLTVGLYAQVIAVAALGGSVVIIAR